MTVIPVVDGVRLSDLAADFERSSGYSPAGGYAGMVLQNFEFGPMAKYLVGDVQELSFWREPGSVYLLGCTCGEVGCWPLQCKVISSNDRIFWQEFQQPHRLERDYVNFGPFVFDLKQYTSAVSAMVEELGP